MFHLIDVRGQTAPAVITEPGDLAIAVGSTANFTASVSGTAPLSFEWRRDGINLAGATNQNLSITNVQLAQAGVFTLVVTNLGGAVTSRVAQLSVAEGRVFTNAAGARLPYRFFVPDHYDPAQKYPLVVFWHGSGGAGTNNLSQLSDGGDGQFIFLSASNRAKHPCFFVAPQIWTTSANCADNLAIIDQGAALLNLLKSEFSIDPDRVYVTGLSHGGYYTWIYATRYANLVAAIVPMSGGWLCHTNFLNIGVPVWNFHAANDAAVSVVNSDNAVTALRSVGQNPVYTRYPAGGHAIWPKAYRTAALVDWLMAQRRGSPATNQPLVKIITPTTNHSFVTMLTNLDLTGTVSHYTNVVQVTWTNIANGTAGTATGTNAWYVRGIPLRTGVTNRIVVTAIAASLSPDLGVAGDTTFNRAIQVIQVPFRLDGLRASPERQSISFTWVAEASKTYRVQFKNNLNNPEWTQSPTLPTISGSTASFEDATNTSTQRFYRVVRFD